MRYLRRKEIEAVQYDGTNYEELAQFTDGDVYINFDKSNKTILLVKGETSISMKPRDYLVKNEDYIEFQKMSKELFENKYREL